MNKALPFALFLSASLLAPAAGAQSLLEGSPAPECTAESDEFPLPAFSALADSAAAAAELGALLKPGEWVTLAVQWDSTGAPDSVGVAQSRAGGEAAGEAARLLRARVKAMPVRTQVVRLGSRAPRAVPIAWGVLVRAEAGAPPRVRVGKQEECRPDLLNRPEVGQAVNRQLARLDPALRRSLPRRAVLMMRIGPDGGVMERRFEERTGVPELDEVALAAARRMRFRPARLNRTPVPVWVTIPIDMQVHY